MRTADEIEKMVQYEINRITLPELAAAIKPLLVPPRMHMRNWDYGKPGDNYPCWTVLEDRKYNVGIAYSDYGFGPHCPWGLVGIDEIQGWFGMDSGWFTSLEDAFCDSVSVEDMPVWNLIKLYQDGSEEVIETALSIDDVCERMNVMNDKRRQQKSQWPYYSLQRRR